MNKVNRLTVVKNNFNSQAEFENAVKEAIMVLLNNDYIMTVKRDDCDVVVIDYDYADSKMGGAYPHWLFSEEYESVVWADDDEV